MLVEKDTFRAPCGVGHAGMIATRSVAATGSWHLQLLLQLDQMLIMALVSLTQLLAGVEVQSSGQPFELLLSL